MSVSNYTLSDVAGILVALVSFFPVLFVPGYVIGWATNCFEYRALLPRWRAVLAVPLSMAVCPAAIYWCAAVAGWPGVSVLFVALFACWVWLLAGNSGHERISAWWKDLASVRRSVWVIGLTWFLIVVASLADIQIGHRLYFSATDFDHSVRTAITDTIARVGSHPNNPFYFLTGPVPLRYHYFWLLPSGFLTHILGSLASARVCIFASAVWCGWGFLALIPATFRFLLGFTGTELWRRSLLAVAFTAVTGLDLFPTWYAYHLGSVFPDMEWWNNNEITSWWGSALWVPHHFAALVIGICGFLICWDVRTATARRRVVACGLLAGVAFGSLVGTSVYVAVVMAVFLAVWTVVAIVKRQSKEAIALAIAGCIAMLIAIPYLHSLSGKGEGGPFMTLSLRHFWPVDNFAARHHLSRNWSLLLRLLGTPFNYFIELGFFSMVGVVYLWRLRWRRGVSSGVQATVLLAAISVFISTFFRSGVISNNDLGMRGFLPAQFVLLLWAGSLFSDRSAQPREPNASLAPALWKSGWSFLLIMGVGATLYQVSMLRVNGMLGDRGLIRPWFASDRQLGERTYALRRAYDAIKTRLRTDAVIQNDPKWKYEDVYFGLYSDRQTAAYDSSCGAQFGGDPQACAESLPSLTSLFEDPDAFNLRSATQFCNSLNIRALVIKDKDGIWNKQPDWIRSLPVIVENAHAKVIEVPPSDQRQETLVPVLDGRTKKLAQ